MFDLGLETVWRNLAGFGAFFGKLVENGVTVLVEATVVDMEQCRIEVAFRSNCRTPDLCLFVVEYNTLTSVKFINEMHPDLG